MFTEAEVEQHLACDCTCHTGEEFNEFEPCCRYCGKSFAQIVEELNATAIGSLNPRGRKEPNSRAEHRLGLDF